MGQFREPLIPDRLLGWALVISEGYQRALTGKWQCVTPNMTLQVSRLNFELTQYGCHPLPKGFAAITLPINLDDGFLKNLVCVFFFWSEYFFLVCVFFLYIVLLKWIIVRACWDFQLTNCLKKKISKAMLSLKHLQHTMQNTRWAMSQENMSLGIWEQIRLNPACSATEAS